MHPPFLRAGVFDLINYVGGRCTFAAMTTNLLLVALFVFSMIIMSLNYSRRKKKVLFLGNALTDMDKRPGGFLSFMVQLIGNDGLDNKYEIMQSIKEGETMFDVSQRLDTDVLLKDVQAVIVHIGLYDVLQSTANNNTTLTVQLIDLYEKMLLKIKEADIKPIVCLPTLAFVQGATPWLRSQLEAFNIQLQQLAGKYQIPTINLSQPFIIGPVTSQADNEPFDLHRALGQRMWLVLKEVKFT